MTVKQAVGTPKAKSAAIPYLTRFVEAASASGFVDELIRHHKVQGLSAA
jgi:polar amino acid transport system substrate-binding protein